MNTKVIKTNKVLSLLVAITMIATMVLPISVFAATEPTITTDLNTKRLVIDETMEFTVTSEKNDGTQIVKGKFEVTANVGDFKLEYEESSTPGEDWYVIPNVDETPLVTGTFGPSAGFRVMDATSKFRVTFNKSGTYDIKVSLVDVSTSADVCFKEIQVTVLDYANYSNLNTAIATANALNEDDYTATSYAELKTAVEAAEAFVAQPKVASDKQTTVDTYTEAIVNKRNALVKLKTVDFIAVAVADDASVNYAKATKIVMVFAEPIADGADILSNLSIKDKIQSAAWRDTANTVYELVLKSDANLTNGTQITYTTNDSIKTKTGYVLNTVSDIQVIGNLEEASAMVTATKMAATIVKASDKPGVVAGDKIVFVFNAPIKDNPSTITIDGKTANAVTGTANTVYELTLDGTEGYTDASTFDYGSITDVALNGTFGTAVAPKALVAIAVDVDGTAKTAGDEIIVLFDRPTNAATNVSALTELGTGAVATWSENDTKLTIKVGTDATIANGATIDISSMGIMDKYDMVDATNTSLAVQGSFGKVIIPEVVRALISDEDGTALTVGDKIYVFFSAPTNKVAGAIETAFTGVLAGATGKWLDNQRLEITLGSTAITESDQIDITSLNIKDLYGIEAIDGTNISLDGSFGVAVQPALLTLTAISKEGKGAPSAGDEIYLAFNVKMREDALNLQNDFEFKNGDYGTGASVNWATGTEYADYSTIIITLGANANVVPGTTKITIKKDLYEETGIKKCIVNQLENRVITGTFGTSIAPSLISASIVKKVTEVGAQAGDQIVLMFNVPTNGADIANLLSVDGASFGNNYNGAWSNNNTIYTITLGDDPTIVNDSSIKFSNISGLLKDINNQKVAGTKTIAINGSFGVEADEVGISPSGVTATIVKTTAVAGAQAGDKIVFAFNVATNGVDLVNYFTSKGKYGTDLTGGWSNGNTIYTLVLGNNPAISDADVVEFTVEAGIKDKNEINNAVTLTTGSFIGSFGETISPESVAPSLMSATIIKGNGNTSGSAQAGDKVVLAFNMATNKADLFANLGGTTLFGSGVNAGGAWNEDGNIYTVTLGDNATITDNTVLTITADAGLKDKQAYSASAIINNIDLIGSFGIEVVPVAPQPELLRVDIVKASADMGAQPGDKLRFIFNISTNEVADLISKIQQTLDGASIVAFGENASGTWVEKNIYEITLGTNPNMQSGIKLVIPASAGIKDESGTSVAKEYTVNEFNGTFGESIAPVALSAVAFSDDGVDYIEVVFNVAVKRLADGIMIFENNSNFLGTEPYGEWMSDNIYRITLDNDYTITNSSLLHFNDTYKILSKDGNAEMAAGSTIAVTGELRKPMVTEVYAGTKIVNGDDVTYEAAEKITIVFSSKTNEKQNIDLTSQSASLGVGATSRWLNSYTLEIILGANRTISVGGGYIVLNGLGITNGFDNNEVVGQYFISAGELPEDELKVVDARVNEKADGSYLTITFNKPTDMNGNIANVVCNKSLGIGATMTWESATKLVVKLGTGNELKVDKNLAEGATVSFTNLKFANGLGDVDTTPIVITGSFDGRETKLDNLTTTVNGEFTVATVTLNKQDLDFGKNVANATDNLDAIVTFVIWDKDGKLVTDMNSMNIDVNAVDKIELQSKFATKTVGKVDVYVTDTYIDAIGENAATFNLLADTVTSAVAAQ